MARCTPYSGLSTFGHGKVYSIQWSEYFWSWQGVLHTVVGVKILKMKSVYCLIIFSGEVSWFVTINKTLMLCFLFTKSPPSSDLNTCPPERINDRNFNISKMLFHVTHFQAR
jgi:hypothetical protein